MLAPELPQLPGQPEAGRLAGDDHGGDDQEQAEPQQEPMAAFNSHRSPGIVEAARCGRVNWQRSRWWRAGAVSADPSCLRVVPGTYTWAAAGDRYSGGHNPETGASRFDLHLNGN